MIDSDRRPASDRHPASNRRPILKSASTDVIISNRRPLTSLSQITFQFKGILKSASFPNSQIYGRFIAIKLTSFSEPITMLIFCHMMDLGQVCTSSDTLCDKVC